jgi:hypothetical protein
MPCIVYICLLYIIASRPTWIFYAKVQRLEVPANVENRICPQRCLHQVHARIVTPNGQLLAAFCRMPIVPSQGGWA